MTVATGETQRRLRTLLIYHEGARLDGDGLARWLASFSEVCGTVIVREPPRDKLARIRRQVRRIGGLRFLDVAAMRLVYRAFIAPRDGRWQKEALVSLSERFPVPPPDSPALITDDPNSPEVVAFISEQAPDIALARCKTLLRDEIFSAPRIGTFIMHPGICPEYRNSHGCFWALANDDYDRVGMTLLKIDAGVDTGPVYGYYSYRYDARRESYVVIQTRVVLENLDAIRDRLLEVAAGTAGPIDTSGRRSNAWGQPWLTKYLRIRWKARRRG